MKKLLAILAIVLFATTAYAQLTPHPFPYTGPNDGTAPWANNPYFSNVIFFDEESGEYYGSRTGWYQNIYYWLDLFHGIPGNPINFDTYDDIDGDLLGQNIQGQWVGPEGQQTFVPYMWNSGAKPEDMYPILDRIVDQSDLTGKLFDCDWMDYPEYVGCTSYFFLFVYRPLCVECECYNWICLGIYSIPSFHNLYFPGDDVNPFAQGGGKIDHFTCQWEITGQAGWLVQVSGEVIDMDNADGVTVTWDWYGQYAPFTGGILGGTNTFQDYGFNNVTHLIGLYAPTMSGDVSQEKYYVGVAANTVQVNSNATAGIKTFEATVSGFYMF